LTEELETAARAQPDERGFSDHRGGTVTNMSIAEVRSQIDQIDEKIVTLLASRQSLAKEAARYKIDEHAVRAPDRRAATMTRLHELALREGVSPEIVRNVYNAMIDGFIDLELREHAPITKP
jgi:isochorismate pyruvate lyase